jgi:cytochrome c553
VAAGKAKVEQADCASCHGKPGRGPDIPTISGLPPSYIGSQLEAFVTGKRTHGSGPMAAPPLKVSAEDTESIAHYLAQAE